MWQGAVVTWDGKVVPCCFDKDANHVMGELKKNLYWMFGNLQLINFLGINYLRIVPRLISVKIAPNSLKSGILESRFLELYLVEIRNSRIFNVNICSTYTQVDRYS
uniref:SPASM domain-containing protein n=1 Tax=Algoriphagus halophilus TaxID=226505 RepID=UPI004037A422